MGFLEEMRGVLNSPDFDIDRQFILIQSKKDEIKYSTPYTMLDLEYDTWDVVEHLRELTICEYSHTLFDDKDVDLPHLYVFGKDINAKQVYIKFKIKGEKSKRIVCVSFHYAKWELQFPYTK